MFAGTFAPAGYAFCNGQVLPISGNDALFSLIGTTYGGDGRTTFALPDLRGRAPIHSGDNSAGPGLTARRLGQTVGSETNTLTVNNLPAHSHTVNAIIEDGDQSSPTGNFPAGTKLLDGEYASNGTSTTMNSGMVSNTGTGASVNNMQPSLAINFIIAIDSGVFPFPARN
ncbi:phage tail protein [Flavobacteriaceae bacterium AU392]|nr:phage tail protein [Flavobacteriaceae bacterium]RKM86642.1 phage tail protein [Flavobacteriaceae bacterium AU392]